MLRLVFPLGLVVLLSGLALLSSGPGGLADPAGAADSTDPAGAIGETDADRIGWPEGRFVKREIPPSPQRGGDPKAGYEYLVNGDYLKSGIPLRVFKLAHPQPAPNHLERSGEAAEIAYPYNLVEAENGEPIVTPNCLSCHAQELNGEFILGLGDTMRDFTVNSGAYAEATDRLIVSTLGPDSPQREAFARFRDAVKTVGPQIRPPIVGVNPADKLAYVLAAHRDPETLRWSETPRLDLPPRNRIVPTDVPAWWLLKKKNAMFYTGLGRGDFARLMMASSLLTLRGTEEAAAIDERFTDVYAFIQTLEAPQYPGEIDEGLAERGRRIFAERCTDCHGTYGEEETYPNLLVSLRKVKTDPLLAEAAVERHGDAIDSYNRSWFAEGPHAAELVPGRGYVAPPLDGVWATAPYLHNGSVPTLAALLDSSERPTYWQRTFDTSDYDLENVGWNYARRKKGGNKYTYDTTRPGYGNEGHTFADSLTDAERRALIEYLKTL